MPKPGRKRKPAPVTLPGAQGRIVETVMLDDPFEAPGVKAPVMRAVNHNPLTYLMHRDRLHGPGETKDDAEARVIAGTRLQGIYERAGGSGAGAIDYSKIRVDVSMRYSGTPAYQAEALQELAAIRKAVGQADYGMLHAICCEQVPFMAWVNSQWPAAGRGTRLEAYEKLRLGLDSLIRYFGIAIGRQSAIRAEVIHISPMEENMA
jgi:hypothetical protein